MKLLLNLIFNFAFVFVKIVNIHRRGRAAFVLCSTSDQRISQISDNNNRAKVSRKPKRDYSTVNILPEKWAEIAYAWCEKNSNTTLSHQNKNSKFNPVFSDPED